jgi:hypothetical protein
MGLQAFRRIQIGRETTRGSAVAATRRLVGQLQFNPELILFRPDDDELEMLSMNRRDTIVGQRTQLSYQGGATYQDLLAFLSMGVKGSVTGVQQGATDAYLWTYGSNTKAKNNQESWTFEYGDDQDQYESAYVMASSLELQVAMNEVAELRAEMFGRMSPDPSGINFTGSLVDRPKIDATGYPRDYDLTDIVANNLKVYIDGTWANLGVTQKSDLVAGANIRIETGLLPVKVADGSLDFTNHVERRKRLILTLDMITNSNFLTEIQAYLNRTRRAIRLQFTGPLISGSHYHLLTIDAIGKYVSAPQIFDDREGENIVSLEFQSEMDSSGVTNNDFNVEVKTTVSSLTKVLDGT